MGICKVSLVMLVGLLLSCEQPVSTGVQTEVDHEPSVEEQPPVISSVTIAPEYARTDDTLMVVVDAASDPAGADLTYTYDWTVNGSAVSGSDSVLGSEHFLRGDVVAVTVRAFHGEVSSEPSGTSITIQNSPPFVSAVSLTPPSPTVADLIQASVQVEDPDGDEVTLSYTWYLNGAPLADHTGPVLPDSVTSAGDEISVTITPNDGIEDGPPAVSSNVTVRSADG